MTAVILSFFILYCGFLVLLIAGWYRVLVVSSQPQKHEPLISVIIAVRNEEHNITHLLDDLLNQQYSNFEIIVIDDHSEDGTPQVVHHYVENNARISLIQSAGIGKKAALTQGVMQARGSVVMTTDGDCNVPDGWIKGMGAYFSEDRVKMVIGGVKMRGGSFFDELQAIEFTSLIGTAGSTCGWNIPTLCNGANLAFRKSAFEDVNGYAGNLHIPSGDDEFLMRKILVKFPASVRFAADPGAVVATSPNADVRQFLNQRIRWAGKWRSNSSVFSKALAFFVFTFQVVFMLLPLLMLRHQFDLTIGMGLFMAKVGLEALLLTRVSRFLTVSWNWSAFLVLQILYPFYVVAIGLFSNFRSFEWKGRKLKSLTVSNN